jgi:hypothetical protein
MKNNSNIYDIDGELIRAISDTHEMTIEEAQERAEYYRKKLEEIGDSDPKAVVYSTYIRNLSMYIFNLYSKHPELLTEALQKQKTTNEQIKEAIDDPDHSKAKALKEAAERSEKLKEYHRVVSENKAFERMVNAETADERREEVRNAGRFDIAAMQVTVGQKPKNLREAMALNAKIDIVKKLEEKKK